MACGCAQRQTPSSEEVGEGNCDDCRTWEEKLYWKRFLPLHFCQILLPAIEFHKQLAIPKKFSKNARAMLPPKVTLRGPSGASWPTMTMLRGEEMYFSDGWEDFLRAYSLQLGDILIFKFDGISVFDVLIFDGKNLCEKELSYFVQHCEHAKPFAVNQRKRISSEASTQQHDDDLTHKRSKYSRVYGRSRKKKSVPRFSVSCSENTSHPPAERVKATVQDAPSGEEPQNIAEINGNCATPAPNENNVIGSSCTEAPSPTGNETDGNCADQETIPNVASAGGRPKRALHSAVLKSYSVSRRIQTKASAKVVASAGGRPKRALCSAVAKSYSVSVGKRIQTKASAKKVASSVSRPKRQLGASKSAEANILGSAVTFNRKYVSPLGRIALEKAQQHMTERSFVAVMHHTTVNRSFMLHVPFEWQKKHLSPESQDLFMRIGDKTWLTRLSYSRLRNKGFICTGWRQFVEENQLRQFDVCMFTFATKKDDAAMLDVSVFRAGRL